MSNKTLEILEQLKALTRLETSELVKQIEESFDVKASARSFTIGPIVSDPIFLIDDELPEYDVILEEVPAEKKIAILKEIRTITGLGLREAKDFVESVPQVVRNTSDRSAAEAIKKQLEASGAKVAIK